MEAAAPPGQSTTPAAGRKEVFIINKVDGRCGLGCCGTEVRFVDPAGPAAAAGVRPGMQLLAVCGQTVASEEQARDLIAGAPESFSITVSAPAASPPTSPAQQPENGAGPARGSPARVPNGGPPRPVSEPGHSSTPASDRRQVRVRSPSGFTDEESEEGEESEEDEETEDDTDRESNSRRSRERRAGHRYRDPAVGVSSLPDGPQAEIDRILERLERDEEEACILTAQHGWTLPLLARALAHLVQTRNCREILMMDLLTDEWVTAVCEVITSNPSIRALSVIRTGGGRLFARGWAAVCGLVHSCPTFQYLTAQNALNNLAGYGLQELGEAVRLTPALRRLDLSYNAIRDRELLPLAVGLMANRTLVSLDLTKNHLQYEALETLANVLRRNPTLEECALEENSVRCPTDTWEGFFVWEQCLVNKALRELGPYETESHRRWPLMWRRRARRLWYVWHAARLTPEPALWARVLQFVDPRRQVNQHVRFWMKRTHH
eukprot:TRINITY_DN16956_c0_g1_i1.p1 TRINITY_DN16956_c0_g1~~TRINITY_DN16956_c0_g1_i1.p1  ORF type:complete len:492 (+),score=113.80 TRINITY_DN16956_c0_g1_i1:79-1554(+)